MVLVCYIYKSCINICGIWLIIFENCIIYFFYGWFKIDIWWLLYIEIIVSGIFVMCVELIVFRID